MFHQRNAKCFFLLFHSSCLPQFEYLFCSQSLVGTQVHDKILNNVGSHISNSTTFQQWVNEIGKELSKTGQIMKKVDWEYFFQYSHSDISYLWGFRDEGVYMYILNIDIHTLLPSVVYITWSAFNGNGNSSTDFYLFI